MSDDRNTIILNLLSEAAATSCSERPFSALDLLLEVSKLLDESNSSLFEPIRDAIGIAASSMAVARARDSANERPTEAHVYFAQRDDGLIKIGFAQDVDFRIRKISSMAGSALTVLAVETGGFEEEQRLHKKFHAHRHHGEWFRPAVEIRAYIDSINARCQDGS